MPDLPVRHNADAARFEAETPDGLAFAAYRRSGGRVAFTHTEVPEAQQGEGVGGALAEAALDWACEEGLTVRPLCPFVADYIRHHPAYGDLVEPPAGR